uniref:Pentatricopeptide repeat-containing protein n=1 Tax=Schistocephalus solidus TaxID=70667 RepID=A0A183TD36_SCHSO
LRSGNIALSHMFCTAFTYHFCEEEAEEGLEDDGSLEQKDLKSDRFSGIGKDDSDLDQTV